MGCFPHLTELELPCSLDDFILCSCEVHGVPQSMYIINISTLPLLKGAPNIYLAILKKNIFFSHKMMKSPVIPPKFTQNLTQKYMLMVFFWFFWHQNLHPIWTAAGTPRQPDFNNRYLQQALNLRRGWFSTHPEISGAKKPKGRNLPRRFLW